VFELIRSIDIIGARSIKGSDLVVETSDGDFAPHNWVNKPFSSMGTGDTEHRYAGQKQSVEKISPSSGKFSPTRRTHTFNESPLINTMNTKKLQDPEELKEVASSLKTRLRKRGLIMQEADDMAPNDFVGNQILMINTSVPKASSYFMPQPYEEDRDSGSSRSSPYGFGDNTP
jgi:hypothetical protein